MLTPEQLEERRKGIGGSEIAAIVGLHPFIGQLDVYLAKTEGLTATSNPDMERGQFLEAGIAAWYAHREGLRVEEVGSLVHPTRPVARCTPDRISYPDGDGPQRLVSIKCPRRAGDRWGETGGGLVPGYAVLQLQWEDLVLRANGYPLAPTSHLVALVDGDLRVYPVERDEELQAWLLEEAEAWWARHVVARVPPPLDGSETAKEWLRRRFPTDTQPMREATPGEDVMMMNLQAAEAGLATAEQDYEVARQHIEQAIGSAGGIYSPSGRVTWRANKLNRRTFKTQWKGTP